jgi:predicted nuclease of predicted toxin-antitoxin system
MKLLLDECLPRKLKALFVGHDVTTVPEHGWSGKKNGELLGLAELEFDVFVTADQNLSYQQRLDDSDLVVVVLVAASNRLEDLVPLVPLVLASLPALNCGEVSRVGLPSE